MTKKNKFKSISMVLVKSSQFKVYWMNVSMASSIWVLLKIPLFKPSSNIMPIKVNVRIDVRI